MSLDAPRSAHEHHHAAFEETLAVEVLDQRRQREALKFELLAQQHVQHDTAGHGDQAHDHRGIQAVPDGQAVFGQLAPHHRLRGRSQQRADSVGRKDADHQAGKHQQLDRRPHPARRFMRGVRQVGGRRAEEHIHGKAQRVGHAKRTANGGNDRQGNFDPGRGVDEHRFGEEHFFRQETVEQRHTGHRRTGHHRQRGGVRH